MSKKLTGLTHRNQTNATSHGITASKPPLIDSDDYESYNDTLARLYDELKPSNVLEEHLIDIIAMCILRQRRAWQAEAYILTAWLASPEDREDSMTARIMLYKINEYEAQLNLFERYSAENDRRMHRAIDQLRALKQRPLSLN